MTPTFSSKDIIVAMRQLDPLPSNFVPPPIFNYRLKHIFVLDRTLFAQTLTNTPNLSSDGLFEMVYEHLMKCFIPKDPSSKFSELFQDVAIVVYGDIPRSMTLMLKANRLLTMEKNIGGLHIIVIGQVFLRLITRFIVF
jgi:hypothetical protein